MLISRSSMIISRRIFQLFNTQYSKGLHSATKKINTRNSRSPKFIAAAGVAGVILGGGYIYYKHQNEIENLDMSIKKYDLLKEKPKVPISRKVVGVTNKSDLELILFQYPTCPFCCKVRAFLDYYGIPYDVVEVDPVLRQQTSWTTYKKVPILLAKVDGGYQQLNDSSMIISALKTHFSNKNINLKDVVNFYPIVTALQDDGKFKPEIMNKYFLMYNDKTVPKEKMTSLMEEKKWREWADEVLVHVLSPNVYRNYDEAMQAFIWFSEVGEWDKLFPSWERNIIVYLGAIAMWGLSKRLKKRHNLKEDVRESLYDECRKWMKQISKKNTTFMGGDSPNLADLAVYGVLSSIEGCLAFNDLLNNTNIGKWYYPMKEAVNNHKGHYDGFA